MLGYLNVPSMYAGYLNQVWSVTRGIVGPAGLPKDVETKLVAALEQVLNSKDHQQKAEQLSLEPKVIKGEDYRKILKANEQDTKKLMGW
jgi:tripartite-type tricarboxylate transporter receptor subunit TctC